MTRKEIEEKIKELQKEIDLLKKNIEDEIFLLSIEEYEQYRYTIPRISNYWWIRPDGKINSLAPVVESSGSIDRIGIAVGSHSGCVRPALKYTNFKSKISKSNKGDDYFIFNEVRWKIIDKKNEIAISELPIGFEKYDNKWNNYENSYIKQWLLDWIKEQE